MWWGNGKDTTRRKCSPANGVNLLCTIINACISLGKSFLRGLRERTKNRAKNLPNLMSQKQHSFPDQCENIELGHHGDDDDDFDDVVKNFAVLMLISEKKIYISLRSSGKRRFNIKLWKTFTDCFNCLPIAAIVDEKIFCCHGGLSPDLQSMEQIRRIMRPTDVPDTGEEDDDDDVVDLDFQSPSTYYPESL